MTNAQLNQQVNELKEKTHRLQARMSELTDDVITLRNEQSKTKQRGQEDMQRVVTSLEQKRIV